jgi:hypothetical protein
MLRDAFDPARDARYAEFVCPIRHGLVQNGAPHATARSTRESVLGTQAGIHIGDPAQFRAIGVHSEPLEPGQGARHEPFSARLVDRRRAGFDHSNIDARLPRQDRSGEPDRAAANDDEFGIRAW